MGAYSGMGLIMGTRRDSGRTERRAAAVQLAHAQLKLAEGDDAGAGLFAMMAAVKLIGLEPKRAKKLLDRGVIGA